jgi:hypothetical protein
MNTYKICTADVNEYLQNMHSRCKWILTKYMYTADVNGYLQNINSRCKWILTKYTQQMKMNTYKIYRADISK